MLVMARLTHFVFLECTCIIALISHNAKVDGIIRSDCPVGCECDSETKKVECTNGNWNELPPLPNGTKILHVKQGNFGPLRKPKDCQSYSGVVDLKLTDNKITLLLDDSFTCMQKLQSLTLQNNYIGHIQNNSFRNVPSLRTIEIKQMHETDFISKLCGLSQLEKLVLGSAPKYISNTDCLGNLKNLSHADLSCLYTLSLSVPLPLKPLKHVSQFISLRGCYTWILTNDSFAGFKVEVLDLSGNYIKHIPRHAFSDMPNLKRLDVRNSTIYDMQDLKWFGELSVHVMHFEDNQLKQLPPISKNMTQVFLGGNDFHKLTNRSLYDLNGLHHLDLSSCGISVIERNAFYNFTKLETLNMDKNNISGTYLANLMMDLVHCPLRILSLSINPLYILNRTFEMFQPNQLEMLYLRSCNIKRILPGTFDNLKRIQLLDLASNHLTELSENTFKGLNCLTHLTLSFNLLTQLSPDIFKGMKSLTYLNLTNNQLAELNPKIFKDLRNLTHLYLDYNKLPDLHVSNTDLRNAPLIELHARNNDINSVEIHNSSTLVVLDLAHNNFQQSYYLQLSYLSSLERLNLSSCHTYDLICVFFNTIPRLSYLALSDNFRVTLDERSGWPLVKLYFLDLSNIEFYPSMIKVWEKLHQLRQLHIRSCKIFNLTSGMFSAMYNLNELDASSNLIPFIEPSAFLNTTYITKLYLYNNKITYVSWGSFVNLPHLAILDIAENPILCTCQVLWILQAVTTNDLVYMRNQDQILCQGPSYVQSSPVKDLKLKVSDCEDKWFLILKPVGIGLSVMVSLFLLFIAWRYRWHVRYALFLARTGRGRYEEFCDDNEYLYDAFVAYSSEDLPWVKNQLLPNIDVDYIGRTGFKLCLHHRDWLVGVDIVENIVKSIAESRRTILVLSKEFALSHWCQYELAMAQMKLDAHGRKRDRLVVILLNDIPANLLTPRLIYILKTKTYLPWSQDPNEHGIFWKTLRKSLRRELLYK